MDVLEQVLETVKLHSSVFCKMKFVGEWGLAKPALTGAPFYVVRSGHLWLRSSSHKAPIKLSAGDTVILPGGDAHDLMSSPTATLVPFKSLLAQLGWEMWTPGTRYKPRILHYGRGSPTSTQLIAGVFGFGDGRDSPLLAALPRLFYLPATPNPIATDGWLSATIDFIEAEIDSGRPGAGAVAGRLADILFIQAIRAYLESSAPKERGWLRGIGDPRIGSSLALIHARPELPWSVAKLAASATMSRSRYALRFHELVGRSPLDYLTQLRMFEASGKLAAGNSALSSLAAKAGYKSEIAFSKAFKRCMGHSPAEFKRRSRAGTDGTAGG